MLVRHRWTCPPIVTLQSVKILSLKKSIGAKFSTAIKCTICDLQYHVGCLVNSCVASNGGMHKSSYQWLAEFLRAVNFFLMCTTCGEHCISPVMRIFVDQLV